MSQILLGLASVSHKMGFRRDTFPQAKLHIHSFFTDVSAAGARPGATGAAFAFAFAFGGAWALSYLMGNIGNFEIINHWGKNMEHDMIFWS